jgi:hypothetical protein
METKICKGCNIEKDIEEFHKYYIDQDKRRGKCRTCLGFKDIPKYTKEDKLLRNREYKLKNREKVLKEKKEYYQRRMQDPVFVLIKRIRNAVYRSLRTNKTKCSLDILGCTQEEFKLHIESQFTEGMGWDRLGEIHIDHIIPISSAETIEDAYRLNHYTNLQPLWAIDNIRKSNKIT